MRKYLAVIIAGLVVPTLFALGALPGPDIISEYLSVNGLKTEYRSSPFNNSSTTICALKSPSATSTMVFGSLNFTTGSSTHGFVFSQAKASTWHGATTSKTGADITLDYGELRTVIASTTDNNTYAANVVFPPNYYWIVKYSATTSGEVFDSSNSFVGSCKAEFVVN